jgi:hypothetical protein
MPPAPTFSADGTASPGPGYTQGLLSIAILPSSVPRSGPSTPHSTTTTTPPDSALGRRKKNNKRLRRDGTRAAVSTRAAFPGLNLTADESDVLTGAGITRTQLTPWLKKCADRAARRHEALIGSAAGGGLGAAQLLERVHKAETEERQARQQILGPCTDVEAVRVGAVLRAIENNAAKEWEKKNKTRAPLPPLPPGGGAPGETSLRRAVLQRRTGETLQQKAGEVGEWPGGRVLGDGVDQVGGALPGRASMRGEKKMMRVRNWAADSG